MIVKKDFIYIHIPKCGGNSVHLGLQAQVTGVNDHPVMFSKHSPISDIPMETRKDKFIFTFVRNPWDRLASRYHSLKEKHLLDMTFESYLENKFVHPDEHMARYIGPKNIGQQKPFPIDMFNQVKWIDETVNFIGRFESMQEDYDYVCNKLGLAQNKLPKVNISENSKTPYQERYTKETKEMVENLCADDIKTLGYSFE
jgi:hypothetical protein